MSLLTSSAFCKNVKHDELDTIEINHPNFSAHVCMQGAQLLSFKPTDKPDFLWVSDKIEYKKDRSLRGGIPICWPWFGVVDKNIDSVKANIQSQAAHGFVRTMIWQLHSLKESVNGVEISLCLESNTETLKLWPFKFKLLAHFSFSHELTVTLETVNTDSKKMHLTQALHTYFPTTDIQATHIRGLNNVPYTDALDQWQEKQQAGKVIFDQEVDRIYQSGGPFSLNSPQQCLTLHTQNCHSTVVWNPWIKKSTTLSQFNDKDYLTMFCVESANALHDVVSIKPTQSHCFSMTLSLA